MFDLTSGERKALWFICVFLLCGVLLKFFWFHDRPIRTAAEHAARQNAPVNINTADARDIERLNGIGPALAQKIVDYRTEHGNFQTSDDLLNVPGIGPKKLEKIKESICLQ